ncbi:helix-turn-helix domain-containing protein [Pseudomonas aeruginosa]
MELHLYPGRQPGWCLTHKQARARCRRRGDRSAWPASPTTRRRRVGVTRPTAGWRGGGCAYPRALYDQPPAARRSTAIAFRALVAQLERHCKRIFQLTPTADDPQGAGSAPPPQLLAGDAPITEIALRCGYTDHSAFSRQFAALTGYSPSQYRETHRQPRKA